MSSTKKPKLTLKPTSKKISLKKATPKKTPSPKKATPKKTPSPKKATPKKKATPAPAPAPAPVKPKATPTPAPAPALPTLEDDFKTFFQGHLGNEQVRLSIKDNATTHELEARLGRYDEKSRRFRPDVSILDFGRVYRSYAEKQPNFTQNIQLDVLYDQNYRITISGATAENSRQEIEYFCSTNHLKENTEYQEKQQILKTDNQEYGYRLSSAKETPIKDPSLIKKLKQKVEDRSVSKYYRYKNRASFPLAGGRMRLDLTAYKESFPNQAGTFVNSFTLDQKEKYMVELEYTGRDFSLKNLQSVFYPELQKLLSIFQNVSTPISKTLSLNVIQEYLKIVSGNPDFNPPNNPTKLKEFSVSKFMALEVIPLTRQNFNNALEDVLASVKADGEHGLLFAHPKFPDQLFRINNRLQVSPVNLLEARSTVKETAPVIMDGEYVAEHQGKSRFLVFDCFYYQGKDIRTYPLKVKQTPKKARGAKSAPKPKYESTPETRFYYVQQFQKQIKNDVMENDIIIQTKDYYDIHDPQFRALFNKEFTDLNPALFPYPLDGLIMTPVKTAYPKIKFQASNNSFQKPSFIRDPDLAPITKWKPPQYLSVDFRVNFYSQGNKQKKIVKINGQDYLEVKLETSYGRNILDFEPVAYRVKDFKIAYLLLDAQRKPKMVPTFQIGEEMHEIDPHSKNYIVKHNDVLEFIWIHTHGQFSTTPSAQSPIRNNPRSISDSWGYWFPIKYREDKTQLGYPNSFKVASDTWVMIHDLQITPKMIMGLSDTNPQLELTYYQIQDEDRKISEDLRNVHNSIKSLLLFLASYNSPKSTSLLDLATGRLGDLGKYKIGLKHVVAVEYDEGNLKAGPNSAFGRYYNYLLDFYRNVNPRTRPIQQPTKIDLIQGNMGLKFDDPNFSNEDIFNHLIDQRAFRHKETFGIVSCQFALHYICDTEQHIDNFFSNVSQNLTTGGIFIATTFDGEKVFQALRRTKGGVLQGTQKGSDKLLWKIDRKYDTKETFKNFGQRIAVTNATISPEPFIEFLVNFKYISKVAEKYNLIPNQLTYQGQALPLDNSYGFQDFSVLYTDKYLNLLQNTQIYNQFLTRRLEESIKNIDPALQRYSEFSSFLIFKKV